MIEYEQLAGVPTLIYANKQDLDLALSPEDIMEQLHLDEINDRQWNIMAASGLSKLGLAEGLDWLTDEIATANN